MMNQPPYLVQEDTGPRKLHDDEEDGSSFITKSLNNMQLFERYNVARTTQGELQYFDVKTGWQSASGFSNYQMNQHGNVNLIPSMNGYYWNQITTQATFGQEISPVRPQVSFVGDNILPTGVQSASGFSNDQMNHPGNCQILFQKTIGQENEVCSPPYQTYQPVIGHPIGPGKAVQLVSGLRNGQMNYLGNSQLQMIQNPDTGNGNQLPFQWTGNQLTDGQTIEVPPMKQVFMVGDDFFQVGVQPTLAYSCHQMKNPTDTHIQKQHLTQSMGKEYGINLQVERPVAKETVSEVPSRFVVRSALENSYEQKHNSGNRLQEKVPSAGIGYGPPSPFQAVSSLDTDTQYLQQEPNFMYNVGQSSIKGHHPTLPLDRSRCHKPSDKNENTKKELKRMGYTDETIDETIQVHGYQCLESTEHFLECQERSLASDKRNAFFAEKPSSVPLDQNFGSKPKSGSTPKFNDAQCFGNAPNSCSAKTFDGNPNSGVGRKYDVALDYGSAPYYDGNQTYGCAQNYGSTPNNGCVPSNDISRNSNVAWNRDVHLMSTTLMYDGPVSGALRSDPTWAHREFATAYPRVTSSFHFNYGATCRVNRSMMLPQTRNRDSTIHATDYDVRRDFEVCSGCNIEPPCVTQLPCKHVVCKKCGHHSIIICLVCKQIVTERCLYDASF